MAQRPWVTPEDIKNYTDYKSIQGRDDKKLAVDIFRAEQYIIKYTNNDFKDEEVIVIPASVKTAVLLVAEIYAYKAVEREGGFKSESFDDYSYTLQDSSVLDFDNLDLESLLEDYINTQSKNKTIMKLRKL